jgi:hypothetical protein
MGGCNEFDEDAFDSSDENGLDEAGATLRGFEWYEIGWLGALSDELSDEKKWRRVKTDRNYPKHKP